MSWPLWGSVRIRRGPREATLNYEHALENMSEGAILIKMYARNVKGGFQHYIVPGGKVSVETAEELKRKNGVIVDSEGLFPGNPQAWRLVECEEGASQ